MVNKAKEKARELVDRFYEIQIGEL